MRDLLDDRDRRLDIGDNEGAQVVEFAIQALHKKAMIQRHDVGFSVWGIDMTPELKNKILEKGFKMSKVKSKYKQLNEMLA
jgi:hypothetical protein